MISENKYPAFCVANYSPEHWKATQKVLIDCGIEIRYLLNGYTPITDREANNPAGVYVRNDVAQVLVTANGFATAQKVFPLTIKTRNIYRHVGKLNIFESTDITDYSPNTQVIEYVPSKEYMPFTVKQSLFAKFLTVVKKIIKHFR